VVATIERKSMKKIKLFMMSLLFFLSGAISFCSQIKDFFVQGNLLYEQGQYQQALLIYEKIENKDFSVWYNMGLSALQQDDKGYALYYFKQAQRHASYNQLTLLQELFDVMNHDEDPEYVKSWLESFLNFMKKCILSISSIMIQFFLLIIVIALLVMWFSYWYKKNIKVSIALLFIWIVLQSLLIIKLTLIEQKIGIVVEKKPIPVLAGPEKSFFMKTELQPAEIVKVGVLEKGYVQISCKHCSGWVDEHDIKIV